MRPGPYQPRYTQRPTALEWLAVLAAMILLLIITTAVVLGALLLAGSPGLVLPVIGGACVWAGLK